MVLRTLGEEDWEDSQLSEHVDRIIFVPTYSKTGALAEPHKLGRAFLWTPADDDWRVIESEWRTFQDFVKKCRLSDAPSLSQTERIHMRPHGRKGTDIDYDPCGNPVTKQCFWLNQAFVQRILASVPRPDGSPRR